MNTLSSTPNVSIIFLIIAMLLSISGLDFITSISVAASAISNVGHVLGDIIGPNGNYKDVPDLSKWILSFGMLLGRLELFANSSNLPSNIPNDKIHLDRSGTSL